MAHRGLRQSERLDQIADTDRLVACREEIENPNSRRVAKNAKKASGRLRLGIGQRRRRNRDAAGDSRVGMDLRNSHIDGHQCIDRYRCVSIVRRDHALDGQTRRKRQPLPLSKPILGVVSIFAILAEWKNFLWPFLILTNSPDRQPLSVRLPAIQAQTQIGVLLASMLIASLVPLLGFLIFQRTFLRGTGLGGALKG